MLSICRAPGLSSGSMSSLGCVGDAQYDLCNGSQLPPWSLEPGFDHLCCGLLGQLKRTFF